jgi:pimeloyl-ACP methyl ester carboxylesterase
VGLAPRDAEGLDWFAGMAPSNVSEFQTAFTDPERFAARLIPRSAAIRSNPAKLLEELRLELTDDDRMIVSDNAIRSMLLRNYLEALRTSPYGWIDDAFALTGPWGFDPAQIDVPVLLWHGGKDVFSPASHSSWLAARIPRVTTVLEPAAAHFAALRALPTALNWLLARPSVASVIIGARNEAQLRDNIGALGWTLSSEQRQRLDAASAVTPAYPYWHQRGFERNPPPVR